MEGLPSASEKEREREEREGGRERERERERLRDRERGGERQIKALGRHFMLQPLWKFLIPST